MPVRGYSTGQTMALMEEIAARTFPARLAYDWTAMSYQEKLVGGQMYALFGMALLLVFLVLAGQYESWYRPLGVILAVPISLIWPVGVLTALKIDNNLYTQIGIVLLSAKNAILSSSLPASSTPMVSPWPMRQSRRRAPDSVRS
jgi:HAE1 family hydrophobic/amphiphilic exporter-1